MERLCCGLFGAVFIPRVFFQNYVGMGGLYHRNRNPVCEDLQCSQKDVACVDINWITKPIGTAELWKSVEVVTLGVFSHCGAVSIMSHSTHCLVP